MAYGIAQGWARPKSTGIAGGRWFAMNCGRAAVLVWIAAVLVLKVGGLLG